MAGRTNYTYTAIYNRSFAKPGRFSAAGALTKAYAMEPLDRDDEDSSRGDTPVLALLFFVLPILGLFAILIQPMRWVFTVAAALSLLTMWGLRCFMPRARLATSVVLTATIGLALYGALAAPSTTLPTGNIGNNLGGDNILSTDALNAALSGGSETDGQSADDGGVLAVQADQSQTPPLSPAETALNSYLELWKQGNNTEERVKLCWPAWR
ncbi:MAG: hypothetical protein LBK46_07615, partial [Oscillospiraceae bacterium]|nr:hypothetical protein [Oscillospiraceae bacterium]